ncbi:hypothetical protein HDV06_002379 [Boothiomyces sp. JEL0866]|nr:hypothetical protein HDV06_002379 [Boothiomyces sp. JEL0866]
MTGSAPATANQHNYCSIYSTDNESLWGYNAAYYLESSDCLEGNLQCFDSMLKLFDDSQCETIIEQYSLTESTQVFDSVLLGNISAHVNTLDGSVSMTYTCFSPSSKANPDFKDTVDYFTTICYVLAIFTSFATLIRTMRKYISQNHRVTIIMICSQFVWVLRAVSKMYITYSPPTQFYDIANVAETFAEISSLLSVWINIILFFKVYKELAKYTILTLLIAAIAHFGLVGLWYCGVVCVYSGSDLCDFIYTIAFLPYSIWFTIFPFVDVVVPGILFYKIRNKCNLRVAKLDDTRRFKYQKTCRLVQRLLIAQVCNAVLSGTIELVQYNTNFFASDKSNFLATSTTTLLVSIHSQLVIILYDLLYNLTYTLVYKDTVAAVDEFSSKAQTNIRSYSTVQFAQTKILNDANKRNF